MSGDQCHVKRQVAWPCFPSNCPALFARPPAFPQASAETAFQAFRAQHDQRQQEVAIAVDPLVPTVLLLRRARYFSVLSGHSEALQRLIPEVWLRLVQAPRDVSATPLAGDATSAQSEPLLQSAGRCAGDMEWVGSEPPEMTSAPLKRSRGGAGQAVAEAEEAAKRQRTGSQQPDLGAVVPLFPGLRNLCRAAEQSGVPLNSTLARVGARTLPLSAGTFMPVYSLVSEQRNA